jgi:glutamine synthetase
MKNPYFALAVFAAAILLSMVREWSAPIACERPVLESHDPQSVGHPQ